AGGDAGGETWAAVQTALKVGRRGLPGGSSLARFLATRRGVRNPKQLPPLTVGQIRAWARAHRRRTGRWPTRSSGPIAEAPGETWKGVGAALRDGYRGLPGGLTLVALLTGRPGASRGSDRPPLTAAQILAWADAHHRRTGAWPTAASGPIPGAPGETWRAVDHAMRTNRRGLGSDWTLARLLADQRGVRPRQPPPRLRERQVLAWADGHRRRTGAWPTSDSGPGPEAPGATWRRAGQA